MSAFNLTLGIVDYVVLVAILLISILIGVYQGLTFKLSDFFALIKSKLKLKVNNNKIEVHEKVASADESANNENGRLDEYLHAESSMSIFPVSFSLFATYFTAVSLIGTPSEVYQNGIQYLITTFGYMNTPIIGALVTGPFFARLGVVSVYEYIELRYNDKWVKLCGNVCYIFKTLTFSAMTTLGPAAAVSLCTSQSQNVTIGLIGFIGTVYTCKLN
jgi:Na+/pantothenate symporter